MKKIMSLFFLVSAICCSSQAFAAPKGTACYIDSARLTNIQKFKWSCPELSEQKLFQISELYSLGYKVVAMSTLSTSIAIVIEQK
ncbi:hypothetical protein MOW14_14875 (plasmid) [Acinetobacter indicus]|uniref:hypothetical protein n=1 Tax=Acinetobacter indicus TaxID=756892 RepID=UPI001FA6AE09|nr:hypothetical protein [Acinetobacter indicus]UNW11112.1 hypothetical protein MOW14_14875 [Acinetobacter indicus]